MKKGEIWRATLNPVTGREQAGFRPVLIISGNLLNTHTDIVIACPLTTKIKNYHGNLILEPDFENGLYEISEVLTSQVRSISKKQLTERMGSIAEAEMLKLHRTLNDLLRY
ncbi:MAG: type II toxin-antitoxin system PemK/MazF family toxin [Cryomorphaceae bacterium]